MPLLFLFDMDDVLYDYDWRVRMAGLTALTGVEFAELRRRWWHDDGEWAAEAGRFADADAYLRAFRAATRTHLTEDEWVTNRRSAMTPWPDSIAVVERAAELGQVSLLTNNGALAQARLADLAPEIAPLFGEHLRTSSFYGARKPNPEVFQRALAAYGAEPHDVFFADDLAPNVDAAASLGISVHLFTDSAAMRDAVEEFASARVSG